MKPEIFLFVLKKMLRAGSSKFNCFILNTLLVPMRSICCILFLFTMAVQASFAQNTGHIMLQTARFITGDEQGWSKPEFDDAAWKEIKVGQVWQRQGFPDYHGYAWYRVHVVIPSTLKNNASWKDSLRIYLAHVNDVDGTFLNGVKIGQIGGFPDEPSGYVSKWPSVREYHIAASSPIIKWDQENIIAIRVYDGGGTGGIFMGEPYIDMLEKFDGIELSGGGDYQFLGQKVRKELSVSNRFNTSIRGSLHYRVVDAVAQKTLEEKTLEVSLGAFQKKTLPIVFPHRPGVELLYEFTESASGKNKQFRQIAPYILTPKTPLAARVNGPSVFGGRPGTPLFYKIPATGKAPITYAVKNLPEGLKLDAAAGIISGVLHRRGDYPLTLVAKNALGSSEKKFTIKVGDLLALTPPMGWNSWNCWGLSVSDAKVRSSAQALIDKGLVNHGWTYMNIDDGWEAPGRAANGEIRTNEKFPDMKALGDYLHSNGIRFGIYSSPGPTTCGGYLGSYQHEEQDAATYVRWGIDYLKYDLCSYSSLISRERTLAEHQKPYLIMKEALKKQPRDIVYSLCQYGINEVWKWGEEMNGNLWRTTGDIEDTWQSLRNIGFNQDKAGPYAKPGRWNDPDMLIVGMVGWGENLHPTRLTPHEQYTHISLWSLLSAPLLIGCDLSKLDTFTLNLLTNDEVIAIDQDPLGKQGRQLIKNDNYQVWVKELEDGSRAIGIFNMTEQYQGIDLQWSEIGLPGSLKVRDVWRQKDLGTYKDQYSSFVPPHGVSLIKVYPNH
jgi:alpha-galactosidase